MKLTLTVCILCIFFVSPVSGDVYTYKDKNGNLHIVDDPDKVPDEYLLKQNNLEFHLKEYTSLENELTGRIVLDLNHSGIDSVFFKHIFSRRFLALMGAAFIICLIIPFLLPGKINKILFLLAVLIVFQMTYLIYWGPEIQKKTYGFATIFTSVLHKSGNDTNMNKYNSRIYTFSHSPLPFFPFSFLFKFYSIMKSHKTLLTYSETEANTTTLPFPYFLKRA